MLDFGGKHTFGALYKSIYLLTF